jgi:uncharacterized protein involved in response to NO
MVGAAGTMTLAVMSRATLGHSGQQPTASAATQAIYVAIIVAALSRICPVIEPAHSEPLLHLAALAWAAAFSVSPFRSARSWSAPVAGSPSRSWRRRLLPASRKPQGFQAFALAWENVTSISVPECDAVLI